MNYEIIKLFKQLAEIDSPSGEEGNVSKFVFDFLTDIGFKPEKLTAGMIYCQTSTNAPRKLFCAHMDTVEPGRGIEVIEKNGYIQSKGNTVLGADNKVAVAAILFALKQHKLANTMPDIELLFTVREETDSGIQQIPKGLIKSKTGFVFDLKDGLNEVALSEPYISDFVIKIYGKASHAARPEDGINALEILLGTKEELSLGRLGSETTFNIGIINGGDATNTVPGTLTLKGDIRSSDKNTFYTHQTKVEEIFNKCALTKGGKVSVEWIPYSFGYTHNLQGTAYNKIENIYTELDLKLDPIKSTGGSDAGFLNHIGIETFNLGYGVENIHTTEERIEIAKFIKLAQIVQFMMSE